MSEVPAVLVPSAPTENVSRGALVALLAIPAAILAFVIVAWVFDLAGGTYPLLAIAVAFLVPNITAWLYTKGAGAKLSSAGRLWFILISLVAVLLGAVASVIATAYFAFTRVGGDGGLFGSAFATTVGNKLGSMDLVVPLGIAVVLGIVSIFLTLRQKTPAQT